MSNMTLFSSSKDYLLIFVIKFMNYKRNIFFKINFNYLYLKRNNKLQLLIFL